MKKKSRNLSQQIERYVMSVALIVVVVITLVMVVSSFLLTDSTIYDTIQLMGKTTSRDIDSNLHLLTERMSMLAIDDVLKDESSSEEEKLAVLETRKTRIEYVWLACYGIDGQKQYGDAEAPQSISGEKYYNLVASTANTVISEPFKLNGEYQLAVTVTMKNASSEVIGYLVGSYKYDMLGDVLSRISLGKTGKAYVINEDGVMLAGENTDVIGQNRNFYEENSSWGNDNVLEKIKDGQSGSGGLSLDGTSCYVAYSPIPGTNWMLLIEAPKSEFLGIVIIAIMVALVVSGVIMVVARIFVRRFAKDISVTLGVASHRLEELSEGNLNSEVVYSNRDDEIDILTKALGCTVGRLNDYIGNIENTLRELSEGNYAYQIEGEYTGDFASIRVALVNIERALNRTMKQVSTASMKVSDESALISEFAGELLSGSQEQSGALVSLQQSVSVVTDKSNEIDDNSRQVAQCAIEANEKVTQGNQQMSFMLSTMNDIYKSMNEITEISKMIERISSQTRLLSLNASIEAARAGEAGKGFAVVAERIGGLAEQTAEALHQTGAIIQQANESIQHGMEAAERTAESLNEIDKASEQFTAISGVLIGIVEQQKIVIEEINSGIMSVMDIASTNEDLAEKTREKTEESLELAHSLQEFVEQVKLKEGDDYNEA